MSGVRKCVAVLYDVTLYSKRCYTATLTDIMTELKTKRKAIESVKNPTA